MANDPWPLRNRLVGCLIILLGVGMPCPLSEGAEMKRPRESATFAQYGWKESPFENHEQSRSPDGSKVAFWSRPGRFGEKTDYLLSVSNVDRTAQEVLLNNVPWGEWVAFSKDGEKLAFGATLDRGAVSSYPFHLLLASKLLSLFVMDLQTKKLQELVRGNVSPLNYSDQIWSSDSSAVLYVTCDGDIRILSFIDGNSRSIAQGEHATWSPTDDLIAFQGSDKHYYVIKPDGTEKRLILRNKPRVFGEFHGPLLWSPTGQHLAVQKQRLSLAEISDDYVLDIRTRRLTKIRPN